MAIKDEHDNYSELRFTGDWWLPGRKKKITGTFQFDPTNGVKLELHDSFFDEKSTLKGSYQQPEFILGESRSGNEITLYNAVITNLTYSFTGRPTLIVSANYFFYGCHILKKDDFKFQKMSVHWQNIETWFAENLFSSTFPSKGNINAQVTFSGPPEFSVSVGKSFLLKSYTRLMTKGFVGQTESGLSYRRTLEVAPSSSRTFSWFMNRLSDLSLLLEVCTAMKLPVTRVRLWRNGTEIYLFFKPGRPLLTGTIHFHDMPLPLPNISQNLQIFFNSWFDVVKAAKTPIFLFSHSSNNKGEAFSHFHFLSCAQFLESFQRNIFGPKKQDLYDRLLFLMKKLLPSSRKWIAPRTQTFCRQVVRNRNYYTHYSKKQKGVLEGVQLYWLTKRLRLLSILNIYDQLGLTKQEAHKAVERSKDLVFIRKTKKRGK